jgi:hypothetical protein
MRGIRTCAVVGALLIVFMEGCIFTPREPQAPGQTQGPKWIVPNTPKDVFLNIKSGLSSNSNSNYERSLDASFTFIPRDADVSQLGSGLFQNWTKDVELGVLTRLKSEYRGERTVQFGDANGRFAKENEEVGKATYEGSYMIVIDPGDGSAKQTYAGIARFVVEQTTQGWALKSWEDIDVNGNYPTSGYLRGTLRASG